MAPPMEKINKPKRANMYTGKGPRYEKRKEAVDEDAAGKKMCRNVAMPRLRRKLK